MSKNNTNSHPYFEELNANTTKLWKKFLPLQLPYKYNLRRQSLGKVLEIGAGLGRNQAFLNDSVGVEHNPRSAQFCQNIGYRVLVPASFHDEFNLFTGPDAVFDSILMSHVLEHIEYENQVKVLKEYIPYLKPSGKIFLITPQEVGHKSTNSHITWTDFNRLEMIINQLGGEFKVIKSFSFPLPRSFGKVFKYNEFNVLAIRY
jgi:SAM-dependent methyltransferase